ncbi:shikimate dehydrogenase [Roseomonas sp. SSH11]|uniref:Shikimate dehydrogenase (NADP(+)) n=1 Tax=Pararoseomonas baculiformis TaxID=2820812 RepID=A0ABS4ALF1_9PROT|nr:shikimate dehydrogenase [Pararoseomonas baculiformis]MBP0447709.1 shikimate dehydrogenase [Pararoseomonas baculiformis]
MRFPSAAPYSRGDSALLGLIGHGIGLSRTPAMHEAEAEALGLRCVYRLIDLAALNLGVEALPELLLAAERMGFTGLNITYPCKQAVIPLLDELSEEAKALGAVNTVVLRDGRRVGHNTDSSGFAEGFRRLLPGAPLACVVQLGAGGAGSAVAHALLAMGTGQLILFDHEAARARSLAQALCARFGTGRAHTGAELEQALAGADGLVHATPTGTAAHPGLPLSARLLHSRLWVSEIVYFPLDTELLRQARERGCRTAHGGGMAVFQAAHAFRLFTGLEPDAARMEAHFAGLGGGLAA